MTSVKRAPVEAMLKAHTGPVLGMHPMFGPDVVDLARQVFVYVRGALPPKPRKNSAGTFVRRHLVVECSAADHDRSMSIIQALRHFTTYAYGVFLSRSGRICARSSRSRPPSTGWSSRWWGVFAQDPRLYADIVLSSEANADIIRLRRELGAELDMVLRRDRDAFIALHDRPRLVRRLGRHRNEGERPDAGTRSGRTPPAGRGRQGTAEAAGGRA